MHTLFLIEGRYNVLKAYAMTESREKLSSLLVYFKQSYFAFTI